MITLESVTRTYGHFTAVDDVSFTARPGRVTGFLGPNGAGKSTTMRIIVGLTRASAGAATVSGRRYVDLPNPGLEVGVLLDASAQHVGRTGREILTIAQRFMGLPRSRVDEMLDLVGLSPEESARRVRDYSLGMRQRLGLATALIGDPAVLILDEPANGLDPAGIRWMRGLLRGFADRGGTVLLSSHLLHEIEVIADDLVVIGNGRIVAQGTKRDLLGAAGSIVRTPDRTVLAAALTADGVTSSYVGPDGLLAQAEADQVGRTAFSRRRTCPRAARRPTAPAWRRCSSSSPPTPHATTSPRSPRMTTTTAVPTVTHHRIPLSRIVTTELRKTIDTRSGFWTVAAIVIVSMLTTGAVILWADLEDLTYRTFTAAISVPLTLALPIIAILSVTSEWSQRTGLTTFALVPHRGRIVLAKAIASVLLAVVAIPVAFAIGALGNVVGTAIAGVDPVWNLTATDLLLLVLADVLGVLVGFMLAVLIRSSAGALATYFVYAFLLPTLALILAESQDWFRDLQPWVDFDFAQNALVDGVVSSQQWTQLAVTGVIWLVVPLAVGLRAVVRAEVK